MTNNMLGYGKPKQNTSSRTNNLKFINKPLSNFDLIEWVKQLGIKYFRGVFSRDNLPNQIDEPEVGIINLDRKFRTWYSLGFLQKC